MPRKKTPPPAGNLHVPVPQAPPTPVLAGVADCHIWNHARWGGPVVDGLNRRGRETVGALEAAVRYAERQGCKAFTVAGDLFHGRRPEPALIAAVQRVFASTKMSCILVPGNHDALDASVAGGNTAMAPLWKDATVVTESTWFQVGGLAVLAIPFDARQPMWEWIGSELERMAASRPGGAGVLITHVGVYDEKDAAPWQVKAKDAMTAEHLLRLLEAHGIGTALVGNYHNHLRRGPAGGPQILQIGTLAPATFSDPEDQVGGMALVSAGSPTPWTVQIPGPRFMRASSFVRGGGGLDGCSYYVRQVGGQLADPDLVAHPERVGWTAFEWQPDQAAGGAAGPDTSLSLDPEAALREALDAVPEDARTAAGEVLWEAWRRGA